MFESIDRPTRLQGLGIVVFAMIFAVGLLVFMWVKVSVVANVLGPAAYAIALGSTLLVAFMVALIADDESFASTPSDVDELAAVPVEITVRKLDMIRRS
jgi:apolipoprotein N-acyltransferase